VNLAVFVETKDDGSGGDNRSTAPVKLSPPTNQHPTFYRLSPNQHCQSTEGKSITFHGLAYPSSPGVFHASHQPSDASTPELRTLPLVNQAQVLYNLCVNYFVAKFCEPKNQISPV